MERELEQACHMTEKGLECVTSCALKEFVGSDFDEIAFNVTKTLLLEDLKRTAENVANKWVRRLAPVAGEIDTIHDIYGTIVCTTNCYQK